MAYSEYLIKSVKTANSQKNSDLTEVRGALIGYIEADPAFKNWQELEDAIAYAEKNGCSPYEPHDGEPFKDESQWDNDYFIRQKVSLRNNFSKERLYHLREVGKAVNTNNWIYGNDSKDSKPSQSTSSGQNKTANAAGNDSCNTRKEAFSSKNYLTPVILAGGILVILIIILILITQR